MTKDVLLALKGMQFAFTDDGNGFPIELITNAQYYEKNDHRYLMYDEMMEGVDSSISNLVKFNDEVIEVTKKGVINVHMVFEEGKQNLSSYVTPYGTIMIGINTHKVEIQENGDSIHLQADYGLDINYEFVSDCQITMDMSPRDQIHLS